ncbi:MAG TPA: hypothetical protein VM938_11890 [Acidimicrobiales bacterium]|nr:hypothetical protein [Acidimicrobiales bacterium]
MTLALVSGGSPAQAQSSVALQFTGSATIPVGLEAAKIETGSFSFTSSACTDVTAGVKKAAGTGPCTISASGTLTGACGSITGSGTAQVRTHDGHLYTATITVASTGGNIGIGLTAVVKVSTNQRGAGAGDATATPSSSTGGAQACLTAPGATKYDIVNGAVTFSVA